VLERVVRESSKPGRVAGHWVLHATAAWSEQHLEQTSDEVAPVLLDAFSVATGIELARIKSLLPHRWRYSIPTVGSLIAGAPEIGLYLAGDAIGWDTDTAVPPAERAWRSGRVAAQSILLSLGSKLI